MTLTVNQLEHRNHGHPYLTYSIGKYNQLMDRWSTVGHTVHLQKTKWTEVLGKWLRTIMHTKHKLFFFSCSKCRVWSSCEKNSASGKFLQMGKMRIIRNNGSPHGDNNNTLILLLLTMVPVIFIKLKSLLSTPTIGLKSLVGRYSRIYSSYKINNFMSRSAPLCTLQFQLDL